MRGGALDRLVDLVRFKQTGKDALNQPVGDWFPLASDLPAEKQDISDGERFRAAETGATITTRFRIRWDPELEDLNPRDRVRFGGREYDIVAVKEIGRREGLEITGTARAE